MSWFSKCFKSKQVFDTTKRVARAAEGILGNESLTSDLDDQAASVLIDWALAWAERVAHDTSSFNDEAAQEEMAPKLKAIRKLMRSINRWGAGYASLEHARKEKYLSEILLQRKALLGSEFFPLPKEEVEALLEQQFDKPAQLVERLCQLL